MAYQFEEIPAYKTYLAVLKDSASTLPAYTADELQNEITVFPGELKCRYPNCSRVFSRTKTLRIHLMKHDVQVEKAKPGRMGTRLAAAATDFYLGVEKEYHKTRQQFNTGSDSAREETAPQLDSAETRPEPGEESDFSDAELVRARDNVTKRRRPLQSSRKPLQRLRASSLERNSDSAITSLSRRSLSPLPADDDETNIVDVGMKEESEVSLSSRIISSEDHGDGPHHLEEASEESTTRAVTGRPAHELLSMFAEILARLTEFLNQAR
ncbi:uncharacterized protein BP01DRAFT_385307 [Aspergillus saccharolyticus JOP 1030-1]|uniref:C2H2-type domain-containing protein n=1 Tax=Aspergillus saccharolyticus JOP 1030-1 TaxID=1450539 RepID=A0A318Z6D8_9EURO|nr:hypothetical protein BP01DRAFT_385307 [Aspergillus saccharolyticus JOP 1030-1]PYH42649.1 hypothetical protein BP01DRAFT_385307 [Aspergillus saccharolyticus JOP 1030-1]